MAGQVWPVMEFSHEGLTLAFYCLLFAHCNIVNVEIWILHDDGEAAVGKP